MVAGGGGKSPAMRARAIKIRSPLVSGGRRRHGSAYTGRCPPPWSRRDRERWCPAVGGRELQTGRRCWGRAGSERKVGDPEENCFSGCVAKGSRLTLGVSGGRALFATRCLSNRNCCQRVLFGGAGITKLLAGLLDVCVCARAL